MATKTPRGEETIGASTLASTAARYAAVPSIGPDEALACLERACEDASLRLFLDGVPSTGSGEDAAKARALADAVAAAALDLVARHAERLDRDTAAAKALEPIDATLVRDPPARALGRHPQLRALVRAESRVGRRARDDAMAALPALARRLELSLIHI